MQRHQHKLGVLRQGAHRGHPCPLLGRDVAARALGRSCAVHYLEEKTRHHERTRTFDLWAWCRDPCDIPTEV
jgi:hypothetical protein